MGGWIDRLQPVVRLWVCGGQPITLGKKKIAELNIPSSQPLEDINLDHSVIFTHARAVVQQATECLLASIGYSSHEGTVWSFDFHIQNVLMSVHDTIEAAERLRPALRDKETGASAFSKPSE